jgi:serine/threonine protein kinase
VVTQYLNGFEVKLREPYDLSFINKYGTVFRVFDKQPSGNLCFGVEKAGRRYFLKFAGAETINKHEFINVEDSIAILKHTVPKYNDLRHPLLINLVDAEDIGGGFITVFDWFDGESCGYLQPEMYEKFRALPVSEIQRVYEGIVEFHSHVAERGYVAIDFNDQSTLYNFDNGDFKICDIDFYVKESYISGTGHTIGEPAIMSPEEFRISGLVDEISNVYTMGATAFIFFADEQQTKEKWRLSSELYEVAKKAVSIKRNHRQQSIRAYLEEWKAASTLC